MPPKRQYDVTPLQVLEALAKLVDAKRAALQAEIDDHPAEWKRKQADELKRHADAVERERQQRAEWDRFQSTLAESQRRASSPYRPGWIPAPPDPDAIYPGPPKRLLDRLALPRCYWWWDYDLTGFAGTWLTESERQRWRKTIRSMESDGLVERDRRLIRMTAEGEAMLTAEAKQ
jgi:hypothetical protein